jgi:hypothetical protein
MGPSSRGYRRLYFAILLIAISLISIQVGAYYDLERFFLSSNSAAQNTGSHGSNGSGNNTDNQNTIAVNTLLNFGNGTSKWFNESRVPIRWNFYNLTISVTNGNVDSTYYGGLLNEHYINAIDGVRQDSSSFWHLWQYCNKDSAWSYSNVGADQIRLVDNQTLAWYFDSFNSYGPPVPGSPTVINCSS